MVSGGARPVVHRRTEHHRDRRLSPEHVAHLGALADDLVHRHPDEAGQGFDHRPHADHRRSDGRAEEPAFRQGSVQYPLLAELIQQAGRRTVDGPADVLAHHDDGLVPAHLFCECLVDRLGESDAGHTCVSSADAQSTGMGFAHMSSCSADGSGYGLVRANSSAPSTSRCAASSTASHSSAVAMP